MLYAVLMGNALLSRSRCACLHAAPLLPSLALHARGADTRSHSHYYQSFAASAIQMAVDRTLGGQAHQVFCNVLGLSVQLLRGFPLHYNAVSLSVCKDKADEDAKSAQRQKHDDKSRYSTYRSGSNTAALAQYTTPASSSHFR